MTASIPLSVLDLVPITTGSTAADALGRTIDLARHAEAFGYRRYWIAEHHLNPGVAGTSPALVISLVAAATESIRVGSGAVQLGHHTPLSVVEQFGIIDALHPGRIDLGLGRSGSRRAANGGGEPEVPRGSEVATRTERGLLIPARVSTPALLTSPRTAMQAALLQQPGAQTPEYAEQIDDILALLAGTYRSSDGVEAHAVPGEGAQVEVWILGSSGGPSAHVAGRRGLPFAANYHISPSAVLEAVAAYLDAFRPSPVLKAPRVLVSADVVVASGDDAARELASPYALWVRSIRTGAGAIEFPTPDEAACHHWTAEDRRLVADRVDTQIIGSPTTVADKLEVLAADTGADELMITTITHDHADRVRSYELLAREWARRVVRPMRISV
ncbi:MAG TPA: LLM class flavin-dependent oxidoreductase [Acidimicrobiales bacterium]|nr:LLM class flavin-dependent oxidoreductase [Acidimicrobiales bacterium]